MAIAACLTLAFIHLQIGLRLPGRNRFAHTFLALSALAVAATGGFELALLRTGNVENYRVLMYSAQFSLGLMFLSLTGFVHYYFGGRRWLAALVIAFAGITLASSSLAPAHLRIRFVESISAIEAIGGAVFTYGHVSSGPLTLLEIFTTVLLIAYVAEASTRAWLSGSRREAALIGGGIIFFLVFSRVYAAGVEYGFLETPYFFIFPFLVLLAAMGHELSLDVIRTVDLSEQIVERDRQVELAARAATLGFWRWHMSADELWATESARVLFGFSANEPLNFNHFIERVHPDDRDVVHRAIERTVDTGEDFEAEYRIWPSGSAERWIGARGRLDSAGNGSTRVMRGVVIDVTDRKLAELNVARARKELAHVSRVSMMGELAGSLAHELNQPLAAILSNAQAARWLLAKDEVDVAQLSEIMDDIVRDDKRAGEVIHRLRSMLQKREHPEGEPIDINAVAEDVARLLYSESTARKVHVALNLSRGLPPVCAGRVEMQQVLLNLLVNGMDAMRDLPPDSRSLTISTVRDGEGVAVTVGDSGPGIPEDRLPDIFRPFFTTKEQGLGMGLAISRSLVEAFEGTLTAANRPGGGAVFTVVLRPFGQGTTP